ncbi:tyrosine--tRNA ligase [Candidatus Wolfebacteria bacterium CG03_land_8_20_14_0_80_40_12]|uniref:Tyrosine--tRNA ligase n=1 Tax=Candidatus Wolfebacteria bacterium CG03_land_8_20_14_0_80_40_12 TaxID=1975069 RepID=A0A2M7B6D1_9BACT|nr:MAG: tyrosine--tRNA ligase [Candidatus Wolfebacteria bacterium CG03_land_8_20_14_0_80_40_12]
MPIETSSQKINELLTRGVEEIIEKESLIRKLKSGKQLRIKLGIDPTTPELHLGNAVVLWKLKEFQDLGHAIIFIIGDFTAQIGDPTDKLSVRKTLAEKEIKTNMKTYQEQAGKIIDLNKAKIVYNNRHLSKMSLPEIYRISRFFTVNQILERDMFKERKNTGKPIWLHEFMYPIFQAYDSMVVKADIEIGGSDQLFNMMMGRQLQPHFNQPPQDIMTMKLLVGTDGKRKMSKSLGNYIGVQESPNEQYGKIMSIPDELIINYFELCSRLPLEETDKIKYNLKNEKLAPRDAKARLAKEIVSLYHGKIAAEKAEKEFDRVFKEKELPTKMSSVVVKEKSLNVLDLLTKVNLISSKSEARRLIEQNGVKIDGETQKNWKKRIEIKKGTVIQVGKRKFVKIS